MKSNFQHPGAYNINTTMFQTSECRRLRIGGQKDKKIDEFFLDEKTRLSSFMMDVSVQIPLLESSVLHVHFNPRGFVCLRRISARVRNALRSTSLI